MNTPAHAIVNLALLGRRTRPDETAPIVAGAVLPDLSIVAFYGWARLVRGASEATIWTTLYFLPEWQVVFDVAHSLPLALAGYVIARATRRARAGALCLSMALHSLFDLPLHHDDAHRHFLPLSGWRFASPLSYWDPRHHGAAGAFGEVLLVTVASIVVARRTTSRAARLVLAVVVLVAVLAYAALYLAR
jgi:hypothetical protein